VLLGSPEARLPQPRGAPKAPRLERLGEPVRPSAVKPPLSPEQFKQLGLRSVAHWKRLDIPFEQLRQIG